jgi:hypothetical protein
VQEGDAYSSALRRNRALGLGDGIPEIVEDALGAADQPAPGLRQTDVPADALEEWDTDFLLEAGYLPRDGRLIRLQRFGRSTEVFDLRNLDKCAEKVGIDAIHASISP